MQVDHLLKWIINNNDLLIESLVGLIVLLVILLAYRTFVSARDTELGTAPGGVSAELEETLKKVLEKANALAPTGAVPTGDQATLLTQISDLKQSLESKQAEIEMLKSAGPAPAEGAAGAADASASAGSSVDTSALEAKIEELQNKLTEYEIISEDIADLSFYKEENVKLQKEVETLKAAGGAAAASASSVAAAATTETVTEAPVVPESETPKSESPLMEQAKPQETQQTSEAAVSTVAEVPEAAPAEANSAPVNDDIMAEFAAAISEQKTQTKEDSEPDSLVNRVQNKIEENKNKTDAPDTATNASTELATNSDQPIANDPPRSSESDDQSNTEAEVSLGSMDMDKMMSEAGNLEITVESKDVDANPLEAELDPAKLSEEAQLLNEFEDFAKKKESS